VASTLEDRRDAFDDADEVVDAIATGEADYLPESYGPPVAAGPEIDSLDARSARLEGGRLRRLVPTERQYEHGAEYPDFEAFTRVDDEPRAPKPSRRQRASAFLREVDPRTIPGPKVPLYVFGMISLLAGWDDAALGLIAPELRSEFGLSVQTLINFGLITQAISIFGGLFTGYLVDRVKRVPMVRIGALGGNFSSIVMAMATSQTMYFGGQFIGLFTGMAAGPAEFPLMADYYPSRVRARVGAFTSMAGQVGRLVGLPLAGFLIVTFGWRQAVLALGALALVTSALTFLLREPVRGGMDRLEFGLSRDLAARTQEPPSWQEAFRAAWSVRTMRRSAYVQIVTQFTTPIGMIIGLIQAEKFFMDANQRATFALVGTLIAIPAIMLGGAFADRLLSFRPASLVVLQAGLFFFSAASTIVNGLMPNMYFFLALMLLQQVAGAMIGPAASVIGSLVVPARVRGLGLQVFVPFQLVGLALTAPLSQLGTQLSLQAALIFFSPFYVIAGVIILSNAATIERDIRNARAAAVASDEVEKAKRHGRDKLLVCRDVDVAYDGVQILFGIDLDVHEGECLALLGTNGAGKSTLLRAISGVEEAENGAIFFDGQDISHVPAHQNARNGIVMMPGGAAVFPAMTVRENLTTAGYMHRADADAVEAGMEKVLDFFPILRERLDLQAGTLSGGEQQMLALGQAFLMRPRLLMIDELSLGLAPAVIEQLLGILRDIRAEGTTVMLVEQSLNVALTVAERAVFMDKGEIQFDGPTEELLRRPDLVRSIFMGGAVGGAAPRVRRRRTTSADGEPEIALSTEGVSVSYGGVHALTDVSLTVAPGEVVGIIGPNGAGKTTLFDVISGYVEPDEGRVLLDREDVTKLAPDARARLGLGRAFQNARLFPPLTVRENIALSLERRTVKSPVLAAVWAPPVRQSERRIAARVDGYIEILGLEGYADKFVRELSTGTRRAVEVACQMAAEPKVLLLDEPSSGLAQSETEALGPALARVVRETGCGLLVIEHDLPLIVQLSDRLIAMELGRVVVTGSPEEVTSDSRVLQSYLAASNDVIERSGSRVGQVLAVVTSSEKGSSRDGHSG
jgi:branched-chain amino acid transport system ATP-binding protein